jgi:hypothetical protein
MKTPVNQKLPKLEDVGLNLNKQLIKGNSQVTEFGSRTDTKTPKFTRQRLYQDGLYLQTAFSAMHANAWRVAGANPAPVFAVAIRGNVCDIAEGDQLVANVVVHYWLDEVAGGLVPNSISDIEADLGGRLDCFVTNIVPPPRQALSVAKAAVNGSYVQVPILGRGKSTQAFNAGEPVVFDFDDDVGVAAESI